MISFRLFDLWISSFIARFLSFKSNKFGFVYLLTDKSGDEFIILDTVRPVQRVSSEQYSVSAAHPRSLSALGGEIFPAPRAADWAGYAGYD